MLGGLSSLLEALIPLCLQANPTLIICNSNLLPNSLKTYMFWLLWPTGQVFMWLNWLNSQIGQLKYRRVVNLF